MGTFAKVMSRHGQSLLPSCVDCKGRSDVIQDMKGGVYLCTNCGLQLGEIIAEGTEWRTFSNDKGGSNKSDPHRVGGPESALTENFTLSTVIGDGGHLTKTHSAVDKKQKNLLQMFKETSVISSRLS